MCCASLRPPATFFLSLGGLPATYKLQAFRVLAVPLVPTPGLVNAATPFAQADARARTPTAGRKARAESMLEMSQGRCLLPQGPPERLAKVARAFLMIHIFDNPLARAVPHKSSWIAVRRP